MKATKLIKQLDAEMLRTVKVDILHYDAAKMIRDQHAALKEMRAVLEKLTLEVNCTLSDEALCSIQSVLKRYRSISK